MSTQVEGLLIEIKAKVDGFEASMASATKKVEALGDEGVDASNKLTSAFKRASAAVAAYFSTRAVIDFGKSLFNASVELERLEFKMLAAVGTTDQVQTSMAFVRAEAERLGIGFVAAADGFASFSASALQGGMTMNEVKNAYTGVLEASSALQLSNERVALVFRAMEQMATKPTIALEELKLQLGDHLPGVLGLAANKIAEKSGNIEFTVADLMQAITDGSVNSIPFINALGEALSDKFGKTAVTAAGGARAALERMNTAMFNLKVTMAEGKFMTSATNAVARFTAVISDQRIQQSLTAILDGVVLITEVVVRGIAKWVEWGMALYNATARAFGFSQATEEAVKSQQKLSEAMAKSPSAMPAPQGAAILADRGAIITPTAPKTKASGPSKEDQMRAMQDRIDALKFTLATETEQEQLEYQKRLAVLQEALAMRAITKAEYDELEVQAAADKAMRIYDIEKQAEEESLRRTEEIEKLKQDMRERAVNAGLALANTFARKNKAIALAVLAFEKARAIAQTLIAAKEGAIKAAAAAAPGGPAASAAAYGSFMSLGYVTAGLIAATGIAEAATMGGGGSGGGGGYGGTTTTTNPYSSSSQQNVASRKTSVYIDLRGDDDATLSRGRVRKLIEQINEAVGDGTMLVVA